VRTTGRRIPEIARELGDLRLHAGNWVRQDRIDRCEQAGHKCERLPSTARLVKAPRPDTQITALGWSYSARDAGDPSAESCAVALDRPQYHSTIAASRRSASHS
jgi:hypothetical protein